VKRILFIAYSTYISDARVRRHAEALVQRGDAVDVICLAPDQAFDDRGVRVIGLRMSRYRGARAAGYINGYLQFFIRASYHAARLSRSKGYDTVVVCTMPDAAVLCGLIPRLRGARLVLDIHDTMPELYQAKFSGWRGRIGARLLKIEERASAALAECVIAVHDLHAQRLIEAGIPKNKIRVIINSPDSALFTREGSPPEAAPGFTLICHGTITRRLGLDVAIRAVASLRERIPGLRLQVFGIGDYVQSARALAASLNLDGQVRFENRVPVEKLPPLLKQAQAGLVPNLANSATHLMLPAKLLEYAALGIPVIAPRLRTIEHYFGEDVFLFEPGEFASMAGAIERVYRDPELARRTAAAAGARMNHLAWNIQRKRLFDAVDSPSRASMRSCI
jgi:glycosyltransferase involved in cell wall biosynthesis